MSRQLGRKLVIPVPCRRRAVQAGYNRIVQRLIFLSENIDPVSVPVIDYVVFRVFQRTGSGRLGKAEDSFL